MLRDPPQSTGWYAHALILAIDLTDTIGRSGVDPDRVVSRLNEFKALGVSCLRLLLDRPVERSADAIAAVIRAARHTDTQVLVDLPRMANAGGDGEQATRVAADRVLRQGADGVVLPVALSAASETPPTSFLRVNGFPVPIDPALGWLTELGLFRAVLPATILQALERETSVPLLGAMVRLALLAAQRRGNPTLQRRESPLPSDGIPLQSLSAMAGDDPLRLRLMQGLALSLPGPPHLVFRGDVDEDLLHSGTETPGAGDDTQAARNGHHSPGIFMEARRRLPVLRYGIMFPVSLGAGGTLAFLRRWRREVVLVAANLTGRPCDVECELTSYDGYSVTDATGNGRRFPKVSTSVYALGLDPFEILWLRLAPD